MTSYSVCHDSGVRNRTSTNVRGSKYGDRITPFRNGKIGLPVNLQAFTYGQHPNSRNNPAADAIHRPRNRASASTRITRLNEMPPNLMDNPKPASAAAAISHLASPSSSKRSSASTAARITAAQNGSTIRLPLSNWISGVEANNAATSSAFIRGIRFSSTVTIIAAVTATNEKFSSRAANSPPGR